MGKVEEYDDLMREIWKIMECVDNIEIFKSEINKSTDLTVSARPLCYDVTIGKDLVYSCNHLENARTIFDVIRADLKGDIFMATRAKLNFKPIDYAYQSLYGIMPDYDYTNRLRAGQPREEVETLVNGRLAAIWKQQKYEHEHREELVWQEPGADCPF